MAEDRTPAPGASLAVILNQAMPELQRMAPKYVNLSRLTALAIEAQQRNPLLSSCSPVSVLNFCKKCAETGTDRVGAGGMWAVPFWNNKTSSYDMTPIPDWRLLIEKSKKAGAITHATSDIVREGEEFYQERGLAPVLIHKPKLANKGKIVAVYCTYTLPDGSRDFACMDWENEIVPIRNRSKAWQNYVKDPKKTCPWVTDEGEMGKKTVVRRAMKPFEGASPELTKLIEADNEVYTARPAVEMPVALPAPAPVEAEVVNPHEPNPIPPEDPQPPEENVEVGLIEAVTEKSGSKAGKDKEGNKIERTWTAYNVKVNGKFHSTFDTKIAETAQEAHAFQTPVRITYSVNEKGYRSIESIEAAV